MDRKDCVWCAEKSCGIREGVFYWYDCKYCGCYTMDRIFDNPYRKRPQEQKHLFAKYLNETKAERNRSNEISNEEWESRCRSVLKKFSEMFGESTG